MLACQVRPTTPSPFPSALHSQDPSSPDVMLHTPRKRPKLSPLPSLPLSLPPAGDTNNSNEDSRDSWDNLDSGDSGEVTPNGSPARIPAPASHPPPAPGPKPISARLIAMLESTQPQLVPQLRRPAATTATAAAAAAAAPAQPWASPAVAAGGEQAGCFMLPRLPTIRRLFAEQQQQQPAEQQQQAEQEQEQGEEGQHGQEHGLKLELHQQQEQEWEQEREAVQAFLDSLEKQVQNRFAARWGLDAEAGTPLPHPLFDWELLPDN